MTVSLQHLPTSINDMFAEVWKQNNADGSVTKVNTFAINEMNVTVNITMTRSKTREIPEGMMWCGGKLCSDEADVTVSPSNEKVEQVVVDFFKSAITPGFGMAPPMPTFQKVVVNGKKIVIA